MRSRFSCEITFPAFLLPIYPCCCIFLFLFLFPSLSLFLFLFLFLDVFSPAAPRALGDGQACRPSCVKIETIATTVTEEGVSLSRLFITIREWLHHVMSPHSRRRSSSSRSIFILSGRAGSVYIDADGRPGTDYPVLGTVPYTNFYCDDQAYPGFFADVETRCQGWHYCDIDGRQASFLCPNGTQFSQAVFVCDWWFNVRCELSPKLYAINSRLYQRPTESPTRPHRVITKELLENIFVKRK
ncbi:uncharacterized protein LOC107218548 isoform X1 [Neodiprion lecontei]|uniref:Uncharacterized protein LOC107218548 isoform X1 n=1 Tax=Neodiprion lecontei TaxID=441921 RepID=A0ABM3G429_NEOLC|nr:uncharacterized protein LOC107218548 isoform X1 [Neodiprion lecontei]